MTSRPGSETKARIVAFDDGSVTEKRDVLATEEPLEVRVVVAGDSRTLAVTMRTPGSDFELAAGFLHGEGVVTAREQIARISYCGDKDLPPEQLYNIVIVELSGATMPDLQRLDRNFYVSSACGVCGKASLDALSLRGQPPVAAGPSVAASVLSSLPDKLRDAQGLFASTGGLHAAGLFTADGELVALREDVGRHNAVDKLIGWSLLEGRLPLADHVVVVSGRSSFEIMQKCLTAGVPVVCAVSAPSSLAVDTARRFGMTLVGFLRGSRFNVYAGEQRISS